MAEFVRITSVKNPIVRRFRDAAAGEFPDLMVADGVALVCEALEFGREIVEIVTSPRLVGSENGRELRRFLIARGIASIDCSDPVLEKISHLTTHQGVAALVRRPEWTGQDLLGERALVVVAAGVRDPGNLGALVRTAEAACATGVIALAGGADPFRDKAVRASAGSIFRTAVIGQVEPAAARELLRDGGVRVVVAEARGERDYRDVDLRGPTALVLGGETSGVPEEFLAGDVERVRIPMGGNVESLNVSVAAGVLLYEAQRQRR